MIPYLDDKVESDGTLLEQAFFWSDFTLTKQVFYHLIHTTKSILLCLFLGWGPRELFA
jgi:high-affinity nickel permease